MPWAVTASCRASSRIWSFMARQWPTVFHWRRWAAKPNIWTPSSIPILRAAPWYHVRDLTGRHQVPPVHGTGELVAVASGHGPVVAVNNDHLARPDSGRPSGQLREQLGVAVGRSHGNDDVHAQGATCAAFAPGTVTSRPVAVSPATTNPRSTPFTSLSHSALSH